MSLFQGSFISVHRCLLDTAVVTCVPDDVVQHHQPLELELQLTVVVFG